MLQFLLHLVDLQVEVFLVDWVLSTLLDELFGDTPESLALLAVGQDLLLVLFGLGVLYVLSEDFQLLISLDHFVLQLTNLLLERHDQEGLLLVLLSSLSQGEKILVRV